ncbi:MAG: hypothetical protein ACR2RV_14010 [Verrucomicrobiales bacterium]
MKIHLISALPLFVCLIFCLRGVIGGGVAPAPAEQAAEDLARRDREMNAGRPQLGGSANRVFLARLAGELGFSEAVERLQIE